MGASRWTDLLDPADEDLRDHLPSDFQDDDFVELLRAATLEADTVRPTLRPRGSYVFGILLIAIAVPEEDRVFYQEVDLVVTRSSILTVRKTPPGEQAFDAKRVRQVCDLRGEDLPPGVVAYHLVDEVAERYLDLLDAVDGEIDELENEIDSWPPDRTRRRMSQLRHDLLHLRQTLAPTRDAVRGVVDGRVDIEGRALFTREVFPAEVERQFASAYDKLLRATESLELSRDLLAAARDYHQSKIANDQNEVMKVLTAIASIILFPTFLVGVYGQNFDHMPELHWRLGYLFSWGVIVAVTVLQIVYFRRKRWL
jgi:magnesium transporter